jgi:hypothetical protein
MVLTDKQKQQIAALESSSDEVIMSMLIDLKEHGELFYLETILDMITGNRSEYLINALVEFISDLKVQAAAPIIANYIEQNIQTKNLIKAVTASWQSRLDFSTSLKPFINILINGDYLIAFEAFTVIENSLDSLNSDELTRIMGEIKRGIPTANRDKQLLLLEMVSVIDKTRRAAR